MKLSRWLLLLLVIFVGSVVSVHSSGVIQSSGWIDNGTTVTAITGRTVVVPGELITNAEFNVGTCTTAATIAASNGNRQKVTLTNAQTCALTFTQPVSGTASVQFKVIQSGAGSFNGLISGCKWPGGGVPVITATSGAVDIVTAYLDGTTTYCVVAQNFQ